MTNLQEVEPGNNDRVGRVLVDTYRQAEAMEEESALRYQRLPARHLDIDVAPRKIAAVEPPIVNRHHVRVRLTNILRLVDSTTPEGEYISAKAHSSLLFFQELDNPGSVSPSDYIYFTLGEKLRKIPQSQLNDQRDVVENWLRKVSGVPYDAGGWRSYLADTRVEQENVVGQFSRFAEQFLPMLLAPLEIDDFKPNYKIEEVQEDKPWRSYVSGDRDKMKVEVNVHQRQMPGWTQGTLELTSAHEMEHIVQAEMVRRGVHDRDVRLNVAYAVSTIPGPEQIGLEGTAILAPDMVEELGVNLSDAARLEMEYRILRYMVYTNTHVALTVGNLPSLLERNQKIRQYLPAETDKSIENAVRERALDPKYRSYHGAYEIGTYMMRRLVNDMSWSERTRFYRALHEHPRTPKQIKNLARIITGRQLENVA